MLNVIIISLCINQCMSAAGAVASAVQYWLYCVSAHSLQTLTTQCTFIFIDCTYTEANPLFTPSCTMALQNRQANTLFVFRTRFLLHLWLFWHEASRACSSFPHEAITDGGEWRRRRRRRGTPHQRHWLFHPVRPFVCRTQQHLLVAVFLSASHEVTLATFYFIIIICFIRVKLFTVCAL